MPVPRVVLDTNVFVSALFGKGPPAQLYRLFTEDRLVLISSSALVAELAEVLLRPELRISPHDVKSAFRLLKQQSILIRPTRRIQDCRDPKDNLVLECALDGEADFIVSGDKDLLVLNPWNHIRILTPSVFLKHLSSA